MTHRPTALAAVLAASLLLFAGLGLPGAAVVLAADSTEEPRPDENDSSSPAEAIPPRPIPGPAGTAAPGPARPTARGRTASLEAIALVNPGETNLLSLEALADKIARHPGVPFLHNEYGNMLLHAGRLEEALAQFEWALGMDRGSARLHNNVGVTNQALQRYGAAKKAFKRAIRIAPNYAMARYNLGTVYDAQGRFSRAIDSYQKAIDLDPSLLDVRVNPQIAGNRHLSAILSQSYIKRGGAVIFPTESFLPKPERQRGGE